MAYTKYSLTPANNTATPPDGAPEGMLPSAVNDTMRDMMAQIRDCGDGIRDGTYTMTAAKITGGTITGVTMTSSSVSVTSLTDSGNLTFTGTGNRITGDFSNATPANRVMFQNSATNSNTFIGVIPNGTGTLGVFEAFSSSDPSNSSNIRIRASTTEGRLESSITGTGTYLPLTMYTNGSERLRIDTSGNVGIGNTNPSSYDSVADNLVVGTTSGNNGITIAAGTLGASTINFADATTGTGIYAGYVDYQHNGDYMRFGTNGGTERMRITSGGEVYIAGTADQGAYNLQCNGTGVWGAGAYVNGSDARIKEDIEPIQSGLDVVEKLNPVTYRYKEEWSKDQSTQTGFIAQELLTALDGQVYVDGVVQQGGEYMSVAYQNIIPILTKSIQELHEIVKAQAAEIALLKSK